MTEQEERQKDCRTQPGAPHFALFEVSVQQAANAPNPIL